MNVLFPLLGGRFSTAVQECKVKGAEWFGRFYIVGRIPGTCYDESRPGSRSYATEEEAIRAILSDPWIQANPDQPIQGADCRFINRNDYQEARP